MKKININGLINKINKNKKVKIFVEENGLSLYIKMQYEDVNIFISKKYVPITITRYYYHNLFNLIKRMYHDFLEKINNEDIFYFNEYQKWGCNENKKY